MRHFAPMILAAWGSAAGLASSSPPTIPGGPLSGDARDCSAGRNHCLRPGAFFATGFLTVQGSAAVVSVFERDGHWYTWKGQIVSGGTAYRTTAATPTTLISGRQVFVFTGGKGVPSSELEALTAHWIPMVVWDIDTAAGTFTTDRGRYAITSARVPSDPRHVHD